MLQGPELVSALCRFHSHNDPEGLGGLYLGAEWTAGCGSLSRLRFRATFGLSNHTELDPPARCPAVASEHGLE